MEVKWTFNNNSPLPTEQASDPFKSISMWEKSWFCFRWTEESDAGLSWILSSRNALIISSKKLRQFQFYISPCGNSLPALIIYYMAWVEAELKTRKIDFQFVFLTERARRSRNENENSTFDGSSSSVGRLNWGWRWSLENHSRSNFVVRDAKLSIICSNDDSIALEVDREAPPATHWNA